jgi:hypothetical protein
LKFFETAKNTAQINLIGSNLIGSIYLQLKPNEYSENVCQKSIILEKER